VVGCTFEDTGCGKTTVVQFLSLVFNQKLYSVNCHATTETSDLIGGLRPVRGRDLLARRMLHKVKDLALRWPFKELLDDIDVPGFISLEIPSDPPRLDNDEPEAEDSFGADAEVEAVTKMLSFARNVYKARPSRQSDKLEKEDEESRKRRKLSPSNPEDVEAVIASLAVVFNEIEDLGRRYSGLFEWSDGPLVQAMKSGQMLLLDEMSLAEDAVLERLNSVLEPSRTLVLAEKGDDGLLDDDTESRVIVSHESFRIFATMNPGGDFGKRELSPALRSRFTEIWVPAVTDRHDFELVLRRTLAGSVSVAPSVDSILDRMLAYIGWFNGTICGEPSSPCSDLVLTLRDMLSWARFIVDARHASKELTLWEAYCHGASLMHLDGLGLGSGLALEDAAVVQAKAMSLLASQVPPGENVSSFGEGRKEIGMHASRSFGSHPFFIPLGPLPILESSFNLVAPTTSLNMFRVLRAMQLSKPVLLEGSPGVGKTRYVTYVLVESCFFGLV
jgi:midasin